MLSSTVPVILQNLTTLKQISLVDCNLRGELPPAVFRLPELETLDLSFNDDIDGSLPEFEWHHHSPLKNISLISTSLSGELPHSIGKLAELEVLILSACQLSGSIPSSVGNLSKLSKLYLSDNDFTGVIPPSISNLTNLEKLFLSNLNVMPGELLISNLANLHKLKSISLSGLKLGGKIPIFLSNVTTLREVYLTNTQVVGRLPQWIGNLTRLEILELDGNQLEGPIPEWFSRLKNLHGLSLSYNNLFGNFDLFSGLKNLEYLILSGTRLTFSHVPQQNYSSLPKLKLLWLESCSLTEFPVFLRDQQELQHLRLGQNRINGSIPQWFVDVTKENLLRFEVFNNHLMGFEQPVTTVLPWTRLEVFDIGGNNFHGHLPIPPVSIKSYDVSNNLFTGVIPEQICMTTSPIKLDFSNNNLSRQLIPRCIADNLADSLQLLNLRGNNFHGIIPRSFSTHCNLKMINLSENQLEGELPRSLANCKMLEVLDIGKNRINDTFPSWLASLPKLQVFVQSHNNFHGRIPAQDSGTRFCCLRIIDLSHNFYTGELPSGMMAVKVEQQPDSYNTKISFIMQLGAAKDVFLEKSEYSMTITSKGSERLYSKILQVFKVIDFSSNNFTGEIPDVIGELRGLQALNLSNNNLEGKIPASLAEDMKDLESLDLSRNMLSGVIPSDMPKLTSLEVFDVSYNRLVGHIPQGNQFDTFLSGSYLGNSRLCGRPLPNECTSAPPVTGANGGSPGSHEVSRWIDWVVRSCGCVSGFIIGTVIGKLYITDKYHEWFVETLRRKGKKATRHPSRC